MDLHDFDDVAENYDLYLEEMYRTEDNHAGFLDFYLDFAKEYGKDGVIDIACGTGAVLLYLAQHGIFADGTDLSEAMCRAALINIRENLVDGGMLTFNTFDPHPVFQAQQMNTKDTDYSLRLEYTNKEGRRERLYNAISYDPYTQIMSGNWKFETLDDNGAVIGERVRPLKMRQTYRQEMRYLLELTGFEIVNVYGGYNKESGEGSAKNVIWCVRKK